MKVSILAAVILSSLFAFTKAQNCVKCQSIVGDLYDPDNKLECPTLFKFQKCIEENKPCTEAAVLFDIEDVGYLIEDKCQDVPVTTDNPCESCKSFTLSMDSDDLRVNCEAAFQFKECVMENSCQTPEYLGMISKMEAYSLANCRPSSQQCAQCMNALQAGMESTMPDNAAETNCKLYKRFKYCAALNECPSSVINQVETIAKQQSGIEECSATMETGCLDCALKLSDELKFNNPDSVCQTIKNLTDCIGDRPVCLDGATEYFELEKNSDAWDCKNSTMMETNHTLACRNCISLHVYRLSQTGANDSCEAVGLLQACLEEVGGDCEEALGSLYEPLEMAINNCTDANMTMGLGDGEQVTGSDACTACVNTYTYNIATIDGSNPALTPYICKIRTEFVDCLAQNQQCKHLLPAPVIEEAERNFSIRFECNANNTSPVRPGELEQCQGCLTTMLENMGKSNRSDFAQATNTACTAAENFDKCLESNPRCRQIVPEQAWSTFEDIRRNCSYINNNRNRTNPHNDKQARCINCVQRYGQTSNQSPSAVCRNVEELQGCLNNIGDCEQVLPSDMRQMMQKVAQLNCPAVSPELVERERRCRSCSEKYSDTKRAIDRNPAEGCQQIREVVQCFEPLNCEQFIPSAAINALKQVEQKLNCGRISTRPPPTAPPTEKTRYGRHTCQSCIQTFQNRMDSFDFSDNRRAKMQTCTAGKEFLTCLESTDDCLQFGRATLIEHAQKNLERLRCEAIIQPSRPYLRECEACARIFLSVPILDCTRVIEFGNCIARYDQCTVAEQSSTFNEALNKRRMIADCGWNPNPSTIRPTPERIVKCLECATVFMEKRRRHENQCLAAREFFACSEKYNRCLEARSSDDYIRAWNIVGSVSRNCSTQRPLPSQTFQNCEECARVFMRSWETRHDPCGSVTTFEACLAQYNQCEEARSSRIFQRAQSNTRSIADCGWNPGASIRRECEACAVAFLNTATRNKTKICAAQSTFTSCVEQYNGCREAHQSTQFQSAQRRMIQDCGVERPTSTEQKCENCALTYLATFNRDDIDACNAQSTFRACIQELNNCQQVQQSANFRASLQRANSLQDCGWNPSRSIIRRCENCAVTYLHTFNRDNVDACAARTAFLSCIQDLNQCQKAEKSANVQNAKQRASNLQDCGLTPRGNLSFCRQCASVLQKKSEASYLNCEMVLEFHGCIQRYNNCREFMQYPSISAAYEKATSLQDCGWKPTISPPTPAPTIPTVSSCQQCSGEFYRKTREITQGDRRNFENLMCEASSTFLACVAQNNCPSEGQAASFMSYANQVVSRYRCSGTAVTQRPPTQRPYTRPPTAQPQPSSRCMQCARSHYDRIRRLDTKSNNATAVACSILDSFTRCIGQSNDCVNPQINRISQEMDRLRGQYRCSATDRITDAQTRETSTEVQTVTRSRTSACGECIETYNTAYRQVDFSNRATARENICKVARAYMLCMSDKQDCKLDPRFKPITQQANDTVQRLQCPSS